MLHIKVYFKNHLSGQKKRGNIDYGIYSFLMLYLISLLWDVNSKRL